MSINQRLAKTLTKKLLPLTILLLALNNSFTSSSANTRLLQSQPINSENSKCRNTTITTESGQECFSASDATSQCCYGNLWGIKMCAALPKTGVEAEGLKAAGFTDLSAIQLLINSKLTGNMELKCSNAAFYSEAVKSKASLCGNIQDSSIANCAKLNDNEIQCCFVQTGLSAVNQFASCIGYAVNKVRMPSYAMKGQGSVFTLSCGASDDEVKVMETCAAVVPKTQEDCYKQAKGSVLCQYGLLDKKSSVCIGMIGDLKLMKDLKLMQNLQNVEIIDASQTTQVIRNNGSYFRYYFGLLFAIALVFA